jgi:hypothetical protein
MAKRSKESAPQFTIQLRTYRLTYEESPKRRLPSGSRAGASSGSASTRGNSQSSASDSATAPKTAADTKSATDFYDSVRVIVDKEGDSKTATHFVMVVAAIEQMLSWKLISKLTHAARSVNTPEGHQVTRSHSAHRCFVV